jgi:hypothetical protein
MNTRPDYDPSLTIYTETSDEQGLLTAHIITNTAPLSPRGPESAHPSLMCYFDTLDELNIAVKAHYGQAAQYVAHTEFLAVMKHHGMSPSMIAA